MRCSFRKIIAAAVICAVAFSGMNSFTAEAKNVIRLSKKNVSIEKGNSCTIKVKGKKIKKTTWKTSDKNKVKLVKKRKKSVVIKSISEGKAKVKAVVKYSAGKKKKLTCNVTVKKAGTDNIGLVSTQQPTQIPVTTHTPNIEATPETPTAVPTLQPLDTIPQEELAVANYPMIFSDVPDPYIARKGDTYYMVSTTMFLNPGIPVMKSTDLVHWQMCGYVYDILEDDDFGNMDNGKDMYSHGSWAASIAYNEEEDYFVVCVNTNDEGCFFFTTNDIENGEWVRYKSDVSFHDSGILFDNGEMYLFANYGNCDMSKVELIPDDDCDGVGRAVRIGQSKRIVQSEAFSGTEGWHSYHIGDYYYLIAIGSPNGIWFRTALCYRTDDLENGEWEEQVIYSGPSGGYDNQGLAQGGMIDTVYGEWYGYLFQDHGSVGRCPSVVQINWNYTDENGVNYKDWPIMGTYDSEGVFHANTSEEPIRINLKDSGQENYIWGDDDFTYSEGEPLKLIWQWNHNPEPQNWSVTENPGYYRIRTGRLSANVYGAKNSLTQRAYGPHCVSETKINVAGLNQGDYAGLCAFQDSYGIIGVTCDKDGRKYIIQGEGKFDEQDDGFYNKVPVNENERVSEPLEADEICVKIEYDFSYTATTIADKADFYYSTDNGITWIKLGKQLNVTNDYTTVFMGARSYLFMYSTEQTGGYADFDYYKVYD